MQTEESVSGEYCLQLCSYHGNPHALKLEEVREPFMARAKKLFSDPHSFGMDLKYLLFIKNIPKYLCDYIFMKTRQPPNGI
jgi:hypothetical protein